MIAVEPDFFLFPFSLFPFPDASEINFISIISDFRIIIILSWTCDKECVFVYNNAKNNVDFLHVIQNKFKEKQKIFVGSLLKFRRFLYFF